LEIGFKMSYIDVKISSLVGENPDTPQGNTSPNYNNIVY
jgi:hypothetical protein